jgi:hypothetical protein
LYVFGGKNEAGRILDDLWAYDSTSNIWGALMQGSLDWPPARLDAVCYIDESAGGVLYIFGGEGVTVLLNDLWAFSLTNLTVTCKQWEKKSMKGDVPPPTSNFAFTKYVENGQPKIAITAGRTIKSYYSDVYV